MNVGPLLTGLADLERALADEYLALGERHADEHDVYHETHAFAERCTAHAAELAHHAARFAGEGEPLWQRLVEQPPPAPGAPPGLVLLRDLRTLVLAAEEVSITWVIAGQAAQALRDDGLLETVRKCHPETELQVKWLTSRIKVGAPQAVVTA